MASETFARAATSEIVMSSQLRSPASSNSASMIAFRGSLGAAAARVGFRSSFSLHLSVAGQGFVSHLRLPVRVNDVI